MRYVDPPWVMPTEPPWPQPSKEWIFAYAVEAAGGLAVTIVAEEATLPETWHMTYDPAGNLKDYAEWMQRPTGEWFEYSERWTVKDALAQVGASPPLGARPFLPLRGYETRHHAQAWPRFPLEEDYGDDDAPLRQRVVAIDGGVEVTVTAEGTYRDWQYRRVLVQHWERGRPWWSSMRLQSSSAAKEEPMPSELEVEVEGKVISWEGI